ncbi:MAG: hypothetical protein EXS09_19675 [Gemmataceae bacterium]|nr:hypothetical protein [Gemmataceae bacterium]
MDSALLKKLFGPSGQWHGACVIMVDADTTIKTMGPDSIGAGGSKTYSPRIPSGRVQAEAVCYHADHHALFAVQIARTKQSTGEDILVKTLSILDINHIVGVEFEGLALLEHLGMDLPPVPDQPRYGPGTLVG